MAARLFHAPIALVSLVDDERQWFKARCGLEASETPREFSFCGHAMLEDQPLVVCDATQDPRFQNNPLVIGDLSIRFYVGAPLRTRDGFGLGSLCVIDTVPRQYPAQDLLDNLVDLAAMVMDSLEFRSAVAARDLSEKKRRQAEERYRLLAETARDLFLIVNAQGVIVTANQAAKGLLGYAPDELVGQPLTLAVPNGFGFNQAASDELKQGVVELTAIHKSGRAIAVEISFSGFDGGEQMFTAILRDVTERNDAMAALKLTAHNLQANQLKLNEAQQIAHLGYWEWDLITKAISWSDETYRLFGLPPRSPITFEQYQGLLPKDDFPWIRAAVSNTIETGEPYTITHSIARQSGSVINVEARGRVERNPDGKIVRLVGTLLDVTARVQADMKLRKSHEELENRIRRRTELLAESNTALEAEAEQHKLTQSIVSGQNRLLRMIAEGVPASQVFDALLQFGEQESHGTFSGAILLKSEDGQSLILAASLNMPEETKAGFRDIQIGPSNGASGAAAYLGERVIVADVLKNPDLAVARIFEKYKGARSLAATPIIGKCNQVLGTISFALPGEIPTEYELRLQDACASLASVALQRDQEQARNVRNIPAGSVVHSGGSINDYSHLNGSRC